MGPCRRLYTFLWFRRVKRKELTFLTWPMFVIAVIMTGSFMLLIRLKCNSESCVSLFRDEISKQRWREQYLNNTFAMLENIFHLSPETLRTAPQILMAEARHIIGGKEGMFPLKFSTFGHTYRRGQAATSKQNSENKDGLQSNVSQLQNLNFMEQDNRNTPQILDTFLQNPDTFQTFHHDRKDKKMSEQIHRLEKAKKSELKGDNSVFKEVTLPSGQDVNNPDQLDPDSLQVREKIDNSGNVASSVQTTQDPLLPALGDFIQRANRVASHCPEISATDLSATVTFSSFGLFEAESVKGVLWHESSRTAYCFVPKAGCTFWIRVYSYLLNSTGQRAPSPWNLSRTAVHQSSNPYAQGTPLWFYDGVAMQEGALRFMVTRDPYARLWSAYVDKFLLPDFWATHGLEVVRKLRQKPTERAKRCGNDVTFSEFVQYLLTWADSDSHWEPVHKRCNPCQFKPHIIVDVDTFSRDSLVVLRKMGIEWVMKNLSKTDQRKLELQTLIDYNFHLIAQSHQHRKCVSEKELASLLWRAFQINGYLPVQAFYSAHQDEHFSVHSFRSRVLEVYQDSSAMETELRSQKRQFMLESYRSLSPELLAKLQELYSHDFALFGYDNSPFT